jgi:hypothetical protein
MISSLNAPKMLSWLTRTLQDRPPGEPCISLLLFVHISVNTSGFVWTHTEAGGGGETLRRQPDPGAYSFMHALTPSGLPTSQYGELKIFDVLERKILARRPFRIRYVFQSSISYRFSRHRTNNPTRAFPSDSPLRIHEPR